MMFKKLACLGCVAIMTLGACSSADALSKEDYISQAKYYGVTAADFNNDANSDSEVTDTHFDSEALDGISLPYTKAKVYVEFNEFFPKDILDGVVDAISEGIDFDLHNTQYEMQGLVETYKDFYAAPDNTAKEHTKFFKYEKLGTQQFRAMSKAANTVYIIYAEIMPLYKLSKGKTYDANVTDWEYFSNGKYKTANVKNYFYGLFGNSRKIELNLRLRVFNTKTGLFSFVSTQRLVGKSHNTSNYQRAIRHSIWSFKTDEENPEYTPLSRTPSDKIHIVLN